VHVDRSIAVFQPCDACSLVGLSLVPSAIDTRLGMISIALARKYVSESKPAFDSSFCVREVAYEQIEMWHGVKYDGRSGLVQDTAGNVIT